LLFLPRRGRFTLHFIFFGPDGKRDIIHPVASEQLLLSHCSSPQNALAELACLPARSLESMRQTTTISGATVHPAGKEENDSNNCGHSCSQNHSGTRRSPSSRLLLPTPLSVQSRTERNISLYALSLLWLGLCSSLVWKHNELIAVFYAFCFSWIMAVGLMICLPANNNNNSNSSANTDTNNKRTVKKIVGTASCFLQLWYLAWTDADKGDGSSNKIHSETQVYRALCTAAGYLAFDHWFSTAPTLQKSLFTVWEDAVTLIAFVVILVQWTAAATTTTVATNTAEDTTASGTSSAITASYVTTTNDSHGWIPHAYTLLAAWTGYKLVQFFYVEDPSTTQLAALSSAKGSTRTKPFQSKGRSIEAATPPTPPAAAIWRINGGRYDLSAYIDHHPGGREAILLGCNRDDCTALFQSYHPFTRQAATRVLAKYRVTTANHNKTKSIPTRTSSNTRSDDDDDDVFYGILIERVRQTLKDQGMDPVLDRTANWQRSLYYVCILVAVAVTAYAHSRVCLCVFCSL
jgi:Cytochrome b5-like Heme/Steroid binding domain